MQDVFPQLVNVTNGVALRVLAGFIATARWQLCGGPGRAACRPSGRSRNNTVTSVSFRTKSALVLTLLLSAILNYLDRQTISILGAERTAP